MSVTARAIGMTREGVASIVVDEDGHLVCNRVGEPSVGCAGDDYMVVYQRGLLPAPSVHRSHRSLLSNFKISTSRGMVNVPWANFSWTPNHDARVRGHL